MGNFKILAKAPCGIMKESCDNANVEMIFKKIKANKYD